MANISAFTWLHQEKKHPYILYMQYYVYIHQSWPPRHHPCRAQLRPCPAEAMADPKGLSNLLPITPTSTTRPGTGVLNKRLLIGSSSDGSGGWFCGCVANAFFFPGLSLLSFHPEPAFFWLTESTLHLFWGGPHNCLDKTWIFWKCGVGLRVEKQLRFRMDSFRAFHDKYPPEN